MKLKDVIWTIRTEVFYVTVTENGVYQKFGVDTNAKKSYAQLKQYFDYEVKEIIPSDDKVEIVLKAKSEEVKEEAKTKTEEKPLTKNDKERMIHKLQSLAKRMDDDIRTMVMMFTDEGFQSEEEEAIKEFTKACLNSDFDTTVKIINQVIATLEEE